MSKIYIETPNNFSDIEKIIITDSEKILETFITFDEIYFYDTCSLQCHSKSINRKQIAQYIKNNNGAIVITQTVLTELGGNRGNIDQSVIDYLNEISCNDIKIVLFKEEKLLDMLKSSTTNSYYECNEILAYAIGQVAGSKGIVNDLDKRLSMKKNIFSKRSESKNLFKKFFEAGLQAKSSGDNMGEEMMFICFIVLSNIPIINKMIFLSNDIKSRSKIISISDYIKRRHDREEPYQLTSLTLFYKLVRCGLISQKEQLRELVKTSFNDNMLNIYYADRYSINIKNLSLNADQYIDNVFDDKEFKVIY